MIVIVAWPQTAKRVNVLTHKEGLIHSVFKIVLLLNYKYLGHRALCILKFQVAPGFAT